MSLFRKMFAISIVLFVLLVTLATIVLAVGLAFGHVEHTPGRLWHRSRR